MEGSNCQMMTKSIKERKRWSAPVSRYSLWPFFGPVSSKAVLHSTTWGICKTQGGYQVCRLHPHSSYDLLKQATQMVIAYILTHKP